MNKAHDTILTTIVLLVASAGMATAAVESSQHPRWRPALESIGSTNLIPNGSFESGTDGWWSLGKGTSWGGDLSSLFGEIRNEGASEGQHCFEIVLGPGRTPITHFNAWPLARIVQTAPLVANIGWVPVTKGKKYTLSAYMRADRPGVHAKLVFRFGTDQRTYAWPSERFRSVTLTQEWERYSFTLPAEEPDVFVAVGPDLGDNAAGEATVWIDAVQLEEGSAPTEFALREGVEVGIETRRFGNVFRPGQVVQLSLTGNNATDETASIRINARMTDYFDRERLTSSIEYKIPPRSIATQPFALNIPELGFYRAHLTLEIHGRTSTRTLDLAVMEPYTEKDSPFGINLAPTTSELCQALQRMGVLWAREWSLDWNQLEPVEGELSFEKSDQQIDRVLDTGMRVTALLPPLPTAAWESEAPDDFEDRLPKDLGYPRSWVPLAYLPKDPAKLNEFVKRAAHHYRHRIQVWEFLNEPVNTVYALPSAKKGLPDANYGVADYVALLEPVSRTIKETNPFTKILGGISVGRMDQMVEDARALKNLGGLDSIDLFNLHLYGLFTETPEEFIEFMREINLVLGNDPGKKLRYPIWVTECGYYGEDDRPWSPWVAPKGHFSATHLLPDERRCSDYTIRFALIMLAHGVEKIFYHQGCEGEVNNGSVDLENPLLGPRAMPQKLSSAHATLANLLGPRPRFAGALAKSDPRGSPAESVHGFAFQCGNRAVLSAWVGERASAQSSWGIEVPSHVKACNIVGAPLSTTTVELGSSPIYLSSNHLSAEELVEKCSLRDLTKTSEE